MFEGLTRNALYRVGIYIRLSKEDSDKVIESESITNQRNILLTYLKENQLALAGEYVDDGVSGTTFDRPAFNRLINDIEDGKINMVVTKDLSRLGRDYIQSGYYVEQYFPMKRVRYVSILDNIDTERTNSSENDIAPFRSILNEMYAKDISKKIRIVFQQKKEDGQFLSTSAPLGYKKDPNDKHHLIIDNETAPIVRRMFKMIIDGYGTTQIANIFTDEHIPTPAMRNKYQTNALSYQYGYWHPGSVRRILRNNVYIGKLEQGKSQTISYKNRQRRKLPKEQWITIDNAHESLIDEETFYTVQRLLDTSAKKTVKKTYLLTGLLKCADCGGSIGMSRANNRNYTYTSCNLYRAYTKRKLCTPHTLNYEALELMVVEKVRELCKLCMDDEKIEQALKQKVENNNYKATLEKTLKEANDKKTKIESNLERLYEDRLNDIITVEMYKSMSEKQNDGLKKIKTEIESLENKLGEFTKEEKEIFSFDYKQIINDFLKLEHPTKEIMSKIIDRIEIHEDKKVDIYYRIKAFEKLK
jgi:site-specific DNA recombinase